MFQEWLAGRSLGTYPMIALAIFLLVFLAVIAHTFLGRDRDARWNRLARLPFEGEDGAEPAAFADEKRSRS
jgi:cbb3-type cytochrome oxidase subunit 3